MCLPIVKLKMTSQHVNEQLKPHFGGFCLTLKYEIINAFATVY